MKYKLKCGDNIELLKKLPDNSIDSIVTDPPYGLSFMNKKWDYDVPSVDFWKEVYRVLKPGGHILSFGGTRTYHRMVVNIEDAGFEIRDQIMWLYGSGFPKSLNIGKAVDKIEGNEREEWLDDKKTKPNIRGCGDHLMISSSGVEAREREPIKHSKGQSKYEGLGTALKPANEPICLARKPLSEKSVAENVLKWGTGGINIDGCRVGFDMTDTNPATNPLYRQQNNYKMPEKGVESEGVVAFTSSKNEVNSEGRFPANIILECMCDDKENHTNPDCPCRLLDEQSGVSKSTANQNYKWDNTNCEGNTFQSRGKYTPRDDKGGASRFFYQAKVSKVERNMGLDGFEEKIIEGRDPGQDERSVAYKKRPSLERNIHPTIKPVALMSYLCRLITPSSGTILDPFMGSGSTGIAALLEGFNFIGMDLDEDYVKIAEARIANYEMYRKFLKK